MKNRDENNITPFKKLWQIAVFLMYTVDIAIVFLLLIGYSVIWFQETYYLFWMGINIIVFFVLFHQQPTKRGRILTLIVIGFALFISFSTVWLFHPYHYVTHLSPKKTNQIIIQYRGNLFEARISNYNVYQRKYKILMKELLVKKITVTIPEGPEWTQQEPFDYMNPQWLDEYRVKMSSVKGIYVFNLH